MPFRLRTLPLLLVVLALACPAAAVDFSGERLTYEFGWRNISAAEVKIRIDPSQVGGEAGYKVSLEVNGKPKLDWIWRIRDRVTALVRAADLRPYRYFFVQREGAFKLDTEINLDAASNMLVSKRTHYKKKGPKQLKSKQATADHFDPVTALMYVRHVEFGPGVSHRIKIFDGKRKHVAEYRCLGAERLKTQLGTFDTWKVRPVMIESEGRDKDAKAEKVKEVTVWIDKKAPHHVLRVESEALWGFIYGELIKK
jgi:Protein of unknown function (DUF3108)